MSSLPPPPPAPPDFDYRPYGVVDPKAAAAAAKAYAKAQRPWYKKKRFIIPLGALAAIFGLAALGGSADEDKPQDVAAAEPTTTAAAPEADAVAPTTAVAPTATPAGPSVLGESDEIDDVTIDTCEVDRTFGSVTVGLTIVNNSSDTSTYFINLGFVDETGAKVGDGYASADNVAPGQTARTEGFGSISDTAGVNVVCQLAEVDRFAS